MSTDSILFISNLDYSYFLVFLIKSHQKFIDFFFTFEVPALTLLISIVLFFINFYSLPCFELLKIRQIMQFSNNVYIVCFEAPRHYYQS